MFWKGREHCNINSNYNFFPAYFGGRRSGIGRMTGTIAISTSVLMRHAKAAVFSLSNYCHPGHKTVVFGECYIVGWGRVWPSSQCDVLDGDWPVF